MHTTHPHTYTHTHSMPYTTLRSTPSGLTLTFRVQMRKAFKCNVKHRNVCQTIAFYPGWQLKESKFASVDVNMDLCEYGSSHYVSPGLQHEENEN